MVSTGYHDVGEEWVQKTTYRQDLLTRDTTVEILLYDDSTDALDDASDVGDITTEPTDGNYTRETLTLDSSDVSFSVVDGDLRAEAMLSFDVTDTTGTVDAWGAVVDFQSDVVNAEGAANPHLISTALFLDGSRDLSNYLTFDLDVRIDLN